MTYSFRKLVEEDYSEAFDILDLLFVSEKPPGFSWDRDKLFHELLMANTFGIFEEENLVGFLAYRHTHEANEITVLAGHPEFQGKGYMKKLLDGVFNAENRSAQWWLEVHEKNDRALQLYLKCGFVITGRRRYYYPDGGDALLMSHKFGA